MFPDLAFNDDSTYDSSAVKSRDIVSMFAGCGGLDLGFQGDFTFLGQYYPPLSNRIVWANDNNRAACHTYKDNIGDHIFCGDIDEFIETLPDSADIVMGGFPCQDVSVNGRQQREKGTRTILYKTMIRAIEELEPAVFVAENVKGLLSSDFGEQILSDFRIPGYSVSYRLYLASDYGVPQRRTRLIIVGVRGAMPFLHPPPQSLMNEVTCEAAIGDLADMNWCEEQAHIWSRAKRSPEQGNRILKANAPSTTIRAEHHGNVQWHYELPRRISLREQARLQSFPDDFRFSGGMRERERQIGNAVPPVMAWHIAREIESQVFS